MSKVHTNYVTGVDKSSAPFFVCASDLDALAFELVSDDVLHLMGFAKLRFSAECR